MIELKKICKSYNNEPVLKKVDLTVADGEFVSIMGASGSGKTTLLNIIGGFLSPDSGSVLWNGEDLSTFDEKRRSVFRTRDMGFMFQSFKLISTLNAIDNVMLPALLSSLSPDIAKQRIDMLSKRLEVYDYMSKFPDQLSGGQQQRVALCRALVTSAPVVILDEPTGALDSHMQSVVMELLSDVNRNEGVTVIQVTHSPEMAEYGSRIIRLRDGEICG